MKNRMIIFKMILAAFIMTSLVLAAGCDKEESADTRQLHEETAAAVNGEHGDDLQTPNEQTASGEIPEESQTTQTKSVYSAEEYEAAGVDELNSVPILMYHRIFHMSNDETEFTGGNVDAGGYNRTSEALAADLQSYYDMGYRCMSLDDFVDGYIDVPFGYSPIVLTFDDGPELAVVEGFDDSGEPVWKEGCAIDVLEKFKASHPDFNMTATFFLNGGLFQNKKEDDIKVLNWMVDNGYDIGNHTWSHGYLDEMSAEMIEEEVGSMYNLLEEIIPGKYVHIIALPFGIPGAEHPLDGAFASLKAGSCQGIEYQTKACLLCAWTRQSSPFMNGYDKWHIKRIRGYDNNGKDFDIQANFEILNNGRRYISDGDPDTIVVREADKDQWLGETFGHEVITY